MGRVIVGIGFFAMVWWFASTDRMFDAVLIIAAAVAWGLVTMEASIERLAKIIDRMNGLDRDQDY